MTNLPTKTVESCLLFSATNLADPSDRLLIQAENEIDAKTRMIDQLGYVVELETATNLFVLADVETGEKVANLKSTEYDKALDEVLLVARWRIGEPVEMVGGALGSGFSDFVETD